mmetsp:Transcript_81305/g.205448  ORF Transcript_81305/g.205448 Transcript_81305/m.205448 type:complete len:200 (+) Transcript_81305:194-793(+)
MLWIHTHETPSSPSRAALTSKRLQLQAQGRRRSRGGIRRWASPCKSVWPHAHRFHRTRAHRCGNPFGLPSCRFAGACFHLPRRSCDVLRSDRSHARGKRKHHLASLQRGKRWTRNAPAAHCTPAAGPGAPHVLCNRLHVGARAQLSTCKFWSSTLRKPRARRASPSPPWRVSKSAARLRSDRSSWCGCRPRTCSSSCQS